MPEGALALNDGCAVVRDLVYLGADLARLRGYDEERRLLELEVKRPYHDGGRVLEDDGVQGLVPAEKGTRGKQYARIARKDYVEGVVAFLL